MYGPIDIPDYDLVDSSDEEFDFYEEINPYFSDENGTSVFYPQPVGPGYSPASTGRKILWNCVPSFGLLLLSILTLGVYLVDNMSPISVFGNNVSVPGRVGPPPTLEVGSGAGSISGTPAAVTTSLTPVSPKSFYFNDFETRRLQNIPGPQHDFLTLFPLSSSGATPSVETGADNP